MIVRVMTRTIVGIPVLSLAAALALTTSAAGQTTCGPGSNWVQGCPAAVDEFDNTGAVLGLDFTLDREVDTNVVLNGPATIQRDAESGGEIDTEIVNMALEGGGVTLTVGAGLGQGGVLAPSTGKVEQQPTDDTLADSFFDVFAEVTLGEGGKHLYNHDPLTVRAVITMVPPATQYIHVITAPIPLYTAPAPGGIHVANLVTASHDTRPQPPDGPAVSEWGMAVIVLLLLTGIAIKFGRRWATNPA